MIFITEVIYEGNINEVISKIFVTEVINATIMEFVVVALSFLRTMVFNVN